jgi:segregation and condensation protein A
MTSAIRRSPVSGTNSGGDRTTAVAGLCLGRCLRARGAGVVEVAVEAACNLTIEDLMLTLGAVQRHSKPSNYVVASTRPYGIEESAARLRTLLGVAPEWDTLQHFLPEGKAQLSPLEMRAALVSTFAATLKLARQGELELQQEGTIRPDQGEAGFPSH